MNSGHFKCVLSFRHFGQGPAPWGLSCVLKVTFKTIQTFRATLVSMWCVPLCIIALMTACVMAETSGQLFPEEQEGVQVGLCSGTPARLHVVCRGWEGWALRPWDCAEDR